jgi:hypothetical protein
MSEIRFNRWSHQSGTGGIYQDSSGNIGIGTSVPTSVLDIQGGSIKIGNDLLTSSGVSTFTSGLNVTGGSVGIGTDNPGDLLTLYGTDPTIKLQDSSGDAFSLIESDNTDEGSLRFRADPLSAGANTHIRFDTDGSERVRITSSGNVGIGTDNPGTKLDVRGRDWANGDIVVGEKGNAGRIKFARGADGSDTGSIGFAAADNNSVLSMNVGSGDGTLTFQTNSTERLRITSDGQVNISAIDGTFRNPSLTNIQRNGLIIFPSSSNGDTNFSDNHMLSIAQGQGNWLDSETGTNHTSWGPLWVYNNGSGSYGKRAGIHYDHKSSEQFKFWSSYGDFVFKTDTGRSGNETAETCDREGLRITYQGYVTKSGMPSFAAGWSGTNVNWNVSSDGWTKITMDSERWDNRGNYDTSTSRFTAPVAGYYLFGCVLQLENSSYSGNPWMYINPLVNGSTSSSVGQGGSRTDAALIDYYNQYQRTDLLELAAGDYVEYWRTGNLTSITFKGGSESYWWGYLVG